MWGQPSSAVQQGEGQEQAGPGDLTCFRDVEGFTCREYNYARTPVLGLRRSDANHQSALPPSS